LLDVDDMDVEAPDEKSVITYTMEYFFRFASEGLKEAAAAQAAEWLKFLRDIFARQNDYERRARLLLAWVEKSRNAWAGYNFGDSLADANRAFDELRHFVVSTKPPQEGEKMDLEALLAEIQTTLQVNGLAPYQVPADVTPEKIQEGIDGLNQAQNDHGRAVRNNRFRFIEKKEHSSSQEVVAQIRASFDSFDQNKNGKLSLVEFEAACMKMGVATKDAAAKEALFNQLSEGTGAINFDQFFTWMKSRTVMSLDDPDSVRGAFSTIADGKPTLSEADLRLLSPEDQEFVRSNFQQVDGNYDYKAFVTQTMGR